VADLYQCAQERTSRERADFLRAAAAGDSDLRPEVEQLLAEDNQSVVLDSPIIVAAGEILNDNPLVPFDFGSGHPEQGRGVQGAVIGPYRIDTLLGVGGMGEVYRARDTKLNRDVAIKILPPAFATDPDRLARFKREAQVLASLNHPNVAQIYGLERLEGLDGLERQDGREGTSARDDPDEGA
jgi:serine/threonine-protein kinase